MITLIDIYIQEVKRRLPEKSRDDIGLELRSTIEDMLPPDYTEDDVKEVLEKMGSPATLASGYRDRPMHLIGPRYFDVYVSLLKMIIPIAIVISLIGMLADYFIGFNGDEAVINVVFKIFGQGVWSVIEVVFQVFFWLTLVFAILERVDNGKDCSPRNMELKKWTPDDLKKITYIPKKKAISKFEVFGSLMWTAIWVTLYFYANQLVGVYEGGGGRLDFVMPAFNQDVLLNYWLLVVIVALLEITLAVYRLIKGQWTHRLAAFAAIVQLIGTVAFMIVLLNPNVLNPDFVKYMADLFDVTIGQFKGWVIKGVIFIFVISTAFNIFDGFRKARIKD